MWSAQDAATSRTFRGNMSHGLSIAAPCRRSGGSHRRLRARDVEAYKAERDSDRDAALNRLAAMSEEIGTLLLGR
jgi:hypothetical protein